MTSGFGNVGPLFDLGSSGLGHGDFLPNILSSVDQPAYHFKLFALDDNSTIQALYTNNFTAGGPGETIIAETGASAFNITEVEIHHAIGPNFRTKNNNLLEATIKITEPLGASLADRLANVANIGVTNWLKTCYFLQLKFHGYDKNTGQYLDMLGGKTWTYPIKIIDLDINVDAGGAKYVMKVVSQSDYSMVGHFNYLGKGFSASATTVGEFYSKLKQWLESEQINEYGYVRHKFNFNIHPVPKNYDTMPEYTHPSTWLIQSIDPALQPNRATSIQGKLLETHIGTNLGETISSLTTMIMSGTAEAQRLISRSSDQFNPSNEAFNAVIWKVVGNARIRNDGKWYDLLDEDYNYEITYDIIPHISHLGLLAFEQKVDAENQQLVQVKTDHMKKQGRLKKEYQYLFTGLNTEVVNFNVEANLVHFAFTPADEENFNMSSSTPELMGQFQENVQGYPKLRAMQNNLISMANSMTRFERGVGQGILNAQAAFESALEQALQGLGRTSRSSSAYIENIPPNQGTLLPQSTDRETHKDRFESMGDLETNIQVGQANYKMFIAQIFGTRPALMNVEVTIKGDPYWLGMTPLEAPVGTLEPTNYMDGINSDNAFLIQFYFPEGVGSNGEPILKKVNVYSGLYVIYELKSIFQNGKFTQVLKSVRNMNAIPKD